jgi:hypothetical protein
MKKFRIHIRIILLLQVMICSITIALSQDEAYRTTELEFDGKVYTAMISDKDTFILQRLEDVSITAPRTFDDYDDYRKYIRYRRYAQKVYPYAVEAIKIFKEVEYATENYSKRKRKRHIKKLSKDLKKEFSEPLKNLTKTQGYILTKMIERELDTPMYDLIKDLRGGFTAGYYHQFGKLYGYNLKDGYEPGIDEFLDIVLQDYDISYEVPN